MNPVLAVTIVLGLLALGEVASLVSRAKVPAILVTFVVMLVLLRTKVIPNDIIEASTFTVAGSLLAPALLLHMGTLIPLTIMKRQWKAVLIVVCGMIAAVGLIFVVVVPIFGYPSFVAGAGPITGGLVAYLITSDALKEAGHSALVTIPLLVFILQSLAGMPLASNLLRRHSVRFRDRLATQLPGAASGQSVTAVRPDDEADPAGDAHDPHAGKARRLLIPERFLNSHMILLFIIFIGGSISVGLEAATGFSYSVWALIIGIAGAYWGIYPIGALERARGSSVALVALLFVVLGALSTITVEQILLDLGVVVAIMLAGTAGLVIGGWVGSKLLGWDPYKGIPVALTALLGFPIDYLISHEVSRSVGRDDAERKAILDDVLAPMLVGGFACVTAGSVVIASILVKTL